MTPATCVSSLPKRHRARATLRRAALACALLLAPAWSAWAGPVGYSAWDVSGTDKLVRFDLATGVGTVIGRIQNADGTEGYSDVDGLAFDAQGLLWAVNDTDNALLSINASTGVAIEVGLLGSGINDMGLAFVGSTLYMSATNSADTVGSLYTVNTTTGAATKVGDFSNGLNVRSLGYYGGSLFGWTGDDTLVSINTANAATTTIGSFGFSPAGRDGMDVDPNTGVIWGLGDAEARTYTLNASTGLATVVAQQVCVENNVSNVNCSGGGFNGLAIQAVPEPGSLALAGLGLLAAWAPRARRRALRT
ncbi:PEP-CTERM sorting domain-containing protein [Rubrivivax rivuli]|uniref:PEP-CTERM sorting domain-containing protein n=1 Tax=Rubrivivax rivuli TaxID=1862385 RepID=UPI0013E408D5|nr:PEP-CTERM sorting domain-containing protein [Rubrivivax rivuli]